MALAVEQIRNIKENHVPVPSVELVPAEYTETLLAYWSEWANTPDIRQWMTANLPQSREEVKQWLYNATHDENRYYFTILADGKTVGLISLRRDQKPATGGEIGIAIGDPAYRSQGVGTKALERILHVASNIGMETVRAHIKPDNDKSLRLFSGQGFEHTGDVTLDGESFMKFEKILRQQKTNPN